MKGHLRDLLIGITALIGLAGIVLMLFLFGELRQLGQEFHTFTLRLDTARGLNSTAPVSIHGVRVGSVATIRPQPDPARGVEVVVRIDARHSLPRQFDVHIDRSLVGDSTLELTPRRDQPPGEFVRPGEVIDGVALTMFDEVAERVSGELDSLRSTLRRIDELAQTYTDVGRQLSRVLQPSADGAPAGSPTVEGTLARIDSALEAAEAWLRDEDLRQNVRHASDRLGDTLEQTGDAARAVSDAARSLEARTQDVSAKLDAVAADARRTLATVEAAVEEIRVAAARVNAGEGTLGQLAANPDLYRSLENAARRLETALLEAQLLIEKWKAEGVPIQF